jgi:hypothetical protein
MSLSIVALRGSLPEQWIVEFRLVTAAMDAECSCIRYLFCSRSMSVVSPELSEQWIVEFRSVTTATDSMCSVHKHMCAAHLLV